LHSGSIAAPFQETNPGCLCLSSNPSVSLPCSCVKRQTGNADLTTGCPRSYVLRKNLYESGLARTTFRAKIRNIAFNPLTVLPLASDISPDNSVQISGGLIG
jgi:hypothetical protein